jgi:hypothetical protein
MTALGATTNFFFDPFGGINYFSIKRGHSHNVFVFSM